MSTNLSSDLLTIDKTNSDRIEIFKAEMMLEKEFDELRLSSEAGFRLCCRCG